MVIYPVVSPHARPQWSLTIPKCFHPALPKHHHRKRIQLAVPEQHVPRLPSLVFGCVLELQPGVRHHVAPTPSASVVASSPNAPSVELGPPPRMERARARSRLLVGRSCRVPVPAGELRAETKNSTAPAGCASLGPRGKVMLPYAKNAPPLAL